MSVVTTTAARSGRWRVLLRGGLSRWILPLLVPLLLIFLWEVVAARSASPFVATPSEVARRLQEMFLAGSSASLRIGGPGWGDLVPSLRRAALGWALAAVGGTAVGLAIGSSARLEAATSPLINLSRSLPTPALIGVFFFLFGTGDLPKVLLIAFGAVWPVLFNAVDGARSLGQVRRDVGRIHRIRPTVWVRRILLPGAMPKVFAGLRTSLAYALILMIITELQKAVDGMGYQLNQVQRDFDYIGLWAILAVLAIVGMVSNGMLVALQHRVLHWHEKAHS